MPAMMLCEPWFQLICSESCAVLSFWYQLVDPLGQSVETGDAEVRNAGIVVHAYLR